jgi:hypothetical protein
MIKFREIEIRYLEFTISASGKFPSIMLKYQLMRPSV